MDKNYQPTSEESIYNLWESNGAFIPKIDQTKTPFSIVLPPPNANDPLHAGHALYVVEDVLIRFHRMLGDPTLWIPGTDHAGIETQFVFEKKLQKEGKSRFDYDRETLYSLIAAYVDQNRDTAIKQMKRLGFSLDWTRTRYTLDDQHNHRVFAVFRRMCQESLVYRDEKIVNYCTFCGTSFSNLEVIHKTVDSSLWYFSYPGISVATTRPETMLGDTAIAVNPSDPRYQHLIGKTIKLPIVGREIKIIGEETIDPKFGTGAVKVTPSHSPEDYDMAKKHHLEFVRIMNYDGKFNENVPEKYRGHYAKEVRQMIVEDMNSLGLLEKTVPYSHEVGHCYKCGRPIEPITAPQWFIKIQSLADKAIAAVESDEVKIFPKRFKKSFLTWMSHIKDWNISRQIVWGQRIPVWYSLGKTPNITVTFVTKNKELITGKWSDLSQKYSFDEIKTGLQNLLAPENATYYLSELEAGDLALQETDTFDTWFSSGQWPYSTLGWEPDGHHSKDFDYFYPTSVLDTMWDILFFWVARMIMMGLYSTGQVPFKVAHMHSRVVDAKGKKMSKSKGNVINPIDIAQTYGADALRMALMYGIAPGSDIPLSDDKVRAQRNFVNKIWNAARFIDMISDRLNSHETKIDPSKLTVDDKEILSKLNTIIASTTKNITAYRFGDATENLYQFFWHDFCDIYIESTKNRGPEVVPVLLTVLETSLKLLHPFMPFITESLYQQLKDKYHLSSNLLMTSTWPSKIS